MSNQLQIESYRISTSVRDNRVSYTWTYDMKSHGLTTRKNQGLMTRKSGTYDSKTRDLRHESAIVTTRNIILMERNIVFLYDYYTKIIHF